MKRSALLVLPLLLLLLAGCGGGQSGCASLVGCGGDARTVGVEPAVSTVAAGNVAVLRVYESGYASPMLSFRVVEKGGGEIDGAPLASDSHEATYTAPATPGTYHVDGVATEDGGGHERTARIAITVTAAQ